jgi:NAD(P)-dependent dehydrogenase (short-subunit alcohol dehydrogenase family)
MDLGLKDKIAVVIASSSGIGRPDEFGSLVAFLASERAGYINGETILIDGGAYRGLM